MRTTLTAILIVLLILKLTATGPVAAWSWWWIFAPLWAPLVVALPALILSLFVLAMREARKGCR